jgi:hypothetical protein
MEINNVSIQPEAFGDAFAGFTCKEVMRLGAASRAWSMIVKSIVLLRFVELLQVNPDDVFLDPGRVMHMIDVLRALAKRKKGRRYDKAFKDMLVNPELFNLTSFLAVDPKTSMEKWKRTFDVLERLNEVAIDRTSLDERTLAILDTVVSISLTALFAHTPKHMIQKTLFSTWMRLKYTMYKKLAPKFLTNVLFDYMRIADDNIFTGFNENWST